MEAEDAAEERAGAAWLKEERAFRLRRWVCCWVSWWWWWKGGGGSKGKEELRGGSWVMAEACPLTDRPISPRARLRRGVSVWSGRAGPAPPPHN